MYFPAGNDFHGVLKIVLKFYFQLYSNTPADFDFKLDRYYIKLELAVLLFESKVLKGG